MWISFLFILRRSWCHFLNFGVNVDDLLLNSGITEMFMNILLRKMKSFYLLQDFYVCSPYLEGETQYFIRVYNPSRI